eukprot:CAMPEP_0181091988 /NCGR_PEP_ID=MMETSP1071-20121207/8687_1 /TAXON_ID=35127 /ORGANISM="Thalassiosira sp., Strain NH16" /LENGTH=1231 /DNA_ID=CAMNT_0023174155 /DNA_START=201 /DNA_END=3893 /DNA_ORIENTATION=-
MKQFWRRSSSQPSTAPVRRNSSSSSLTASLHSNGGVLSKKLPSITTPSPNLSSPSMPSRKQRMQVLKRIIHHADAVQNKYLVPKQLLDPNSIKSSGGIMSIDNMSNMFNSNDTATAEINDKCYQRWHQVLQEGLVPMSVHALNLLQRSSTIGDDAGNDEEEAYFATMEGLDEEIQVMAILSRAAAFSDIAAGEDDNKSASVESNDGMGQINAMMKCTAMLLFHVVLAASTPVSSDESLQENTGKAMKNDGSAKAPKPVAGYDGRVRHVMKLACVDVLTRAIIESVDSIDVGTNGSIATDEEDQSCGLYDMDEYTLWNVPNIKQFLDQKDLGQDAIFGNPFNQSSGANLESGKMLLESCEEKQKKQKQEKRQSQLEADEQTSTSGAMTRQSQSDVDESNNGEMPPNSCSMDSSDSSLSLEVQLEQIKAPRAKSLDNIHQEENGIDDVDESNSHLSEQSENEKLDRIVHGEYVQQDDHIELDVRNRSKEGGQDEMEPETHDGAKLDEIAKELPALARRESNAKFLATRKFELIERLVAIDVVRFLMAEEREIKLREKELKERKKRISVPNNCSDGVEDGAREDNVVDESLEQDEMSNSHILTASRVRQIKRGAKIAGAGLALGTVFAITGGLAAPALAAGIGGIAALTGASTASSAALLAVLATFKAGAALFGVGGGGLAAYKMKKRTAGLSQFEIRRENIEQYMYPGSSESKMKKGIEQMMPQLHTTVAVTGWLRENDIADFQLAWGIQPTCEQAAEDKLKIRQMKRFYSIYNPPLVGLCESFMCILQKRLKEEFSWDRIWHQLEQKYGANPDHMLPIDKPHDNEVFLSYEEKDMIDGLLNDAKIDNLRKRGFRIQGEIDFNENDELAKILAKVSPQKRPSKCRQTADRESELDLSALEDALVTELESDLAINGSDGGVDGLDFPGDLASDSKVQMADQYDEKKTETFTEADERTGVKVPRDDPSTQERMSMQYEQQESSLKNKQEGIGVPKMADTDRPHRRNAQDPPVKNEESREENIDDERSPVVWDWKRLYGSSDVHTVTWESKMLSSLCHIVENLAVEVSTQATKVALQYSVIGAIISAIAIPSALVTASKLIDDPYQIVVIRADEAGRELAKCLLQSDERRPVTLVGFSFGARVVYSCLRELARQQDIWEENRAPKNETQVSKSSVFSSKKKISKEERPFEYDREPASLVADVVFIGLPRAIEKKVLTSCRRVTGGRFVNCYIRNDW